MSENKGLHGDFLGPPPLVTAWTQGTIVKSVQYGTITIGNTSLTGTATITTVVPTNALVFFLGLVHQEAADGISVPFSYLQLTNATTVTATRAIQPGAGAATPVIGFCVLEFLPGVIRSIQKGTVTLNAVTSNTATITAVNVAKSILLYGFESSDQNLVTDALARITLTNATTVTMTRNNNTGVVVGAFTVVEFY